MNEERSAATPIGHFFDVLFALVIFNSFLQWHAIGSWQARVLILFLYVVVVNDWLASRAGYGLAGLALVAFNLVDLFLLTNIVKLLVMPSLHIGYDPRFWLYLVGLSLSYVGWDFLAASQLANPAKRQLRKWALLMLSCAALCGATFVGIQRLVPFLLSANVAGIEVWVAIAALPAMAYWVVLIGVWTKSLFVFSQAIIQATSRIAKRQAS